MRVAAEPPFRTSLCYRVRHDTDWHRKENQERQKLVDIVDDIVAAIPDYKRKISELVECEEVVKATLKEKTDMIRGKHRKGPKKDSKNGRKED